MLNDDTIIFFFFLNRRNLHIVVNAPRRRYFSYFLRCLWLHLPSFQVNLLTYGTERRKKRSREWVERERRKERNKASTHACLCIRNEGLRLWLSILLFCSAVWDYGTIWWYAKTRFIPLGFFFFFRNQSHIYHIRHVDNILSTVRIFFGFFFCFVKDMCQ